MTVKDRKGKQLAELISRPVKAPDKRLLKKSQSSVVVVNRAPPPPIKRSEKRFGPVTTIDTAPVSIGNSYRGAAPVVVPSRDGVRVKGRDYFFTLASVSSAVTTNWALVGAAPITPACMAASVLRAYCIGYAEYKFHSLTFHYITTAATSAQGSVLMYVNKERDGPGLNSASTNFLPVVLSDHNTVISPLWTNTSASFIPITEWLQTDVGNDEPLKHQAAGELFVYTKSSSTTSPGFLLMDYDISFRIMQTNPKSLTFPMPRMKYTQVNLSSSASVTTGNAATFAWNTGSLLDNVTLSSAPVGVARGDVYKFVFNAGNSAFNGASNTTLIRQTLIAGNTSSVTINDGFTMFLVVAGGDTNAVYCFPNWLTGETMASPYSWGVTAGLTVQLNGWVSWVGTIGGSELQYNA